MTRKGIPSQLQALNKRIDALGAELDELAERREQDTARLDAEIAEMWRAVRWLEKHL